MLRALEIRDILIIDQLELSFQPGLNVLTGETGAGKSILLDSLGFVLGWRGRADLVRQGADQGEVTAVFDISDDHPARAIISDAGLTVDDELVLRRVNYSDGRKSAWLNDKRVSTDVLRAVSGTLIEVHGQHDDRGLLDQKGHLTILDDFAGHHLLQHTVREAWRELSAAKRAQKQAEQELQAVKAEEDFLRHAVAEMNKLDPQVAEEAELDALRRKMQGAERVRGDLQRALHALGTEAAEGAIGDAMRWLEGISDQVEDALLPALEALARTFSELGEATNTIERVLDSYAFNPHELEETEERLFAIRALARKHNVLPDDLGDLAQTLRARLEALDQGDTQLEALIRAVKDAQYGFDQASQSLSRSRKEAAVRLDAAVMNELAPLKMERAVFRTKLSDALGGADGTDEVEFTVATNPGAPEGPIGKIASGGELSRFLLALKVCLVGRSGEVTMIFDEIDRGVGGATADAVGRRLAALGGQVLVVTHSPQVAALGAHHWKVEKRVENNITLSTVTQLKQEDRVDEIARMLAGDRITEEARAAARTLLSA